MSFWGQLDPKYRLILCDIWGVIHNGVELYEGASLRLKQWRDDHRSVVLLTNAPRTAEAVQQQLLELGLPRDRWDFILTSGEAGISALIALGRPVGFIGTAEDRTVLERRGVRISTGGGVLDLACTGLEEGRPSPDQYRSQLEELKQRNVQFHCLNPDRQVVRGGSTEACAGALADMYQELGGSVTWYGKPFPPIYEHALRLVPQIAKGEVLAIGDGLQTDMLGAAGMGLDAVFVGSGIHSGEPFPEDFARTHGLDEWRPVAVVDGLS